MSDALASSTGSWIFDKIWYVFYAGLELQCFADYLLATDVETGIGVARDDSDLPLEDLARDTGTDSEVAAT